MRVKDSAPIGRDKVSGAIVKRAHPRFDRFLKMRKSKNAVFMKTDLKSVIFSQGQKFCPEVYKPDFQLNFWCVLANSWLYIHIYIYIYI